MTSRNYALESRAAEQRKIQAEPNSDQFQVGDRVRWLKAVGHSGGATCVHWYRGRAMRGNNVLILLDGRHQSFAVKVSEVEAACT